MKDEIKKYLGENEEIFGYEVLFEINDNQKIEYKHIFAEKKEAIGYYCIVLACDGFYYVGDISENKKIICWAQFSSLQEACKAL